MAGRLVTERHYDPSRSREKAVRLESNRSGRGLALTRMNLAASSRKGVAGRLVTFMGCMHTEPYYVMHASH